MGISFLFTRVQIYMSLASALRNKLEAPAVAATLARDIIPWPTPAQNLTAVFCITWFLKYWLMSPN